MSKDQRISVQEITKCVSVFLLLKKWGQELDDWKYIDEIECHSWEVTKIFTKERTYMFCFFLIIQDHSSDDDYETS